MAITLPALNGNSPISADLMYRFYDNKAITPQVRAALQKKQDEEAKASENSNSGQSSSKPADKPGPAVKMDISEQMIRMSMKSKTAKLEDLKSNVKPSQAVLDIEKKLAEQEAAKQEAAKKG